MDYLLLISLYIEIYLLYKIERTRWGTIYTPLNTLMLPYSILLPISIMAYHFKSGYSFYYPSILIWMFGLLLFEIPSYWLSTKIPQSVERDKSVSKNSHTSKLYIRTNIVVLSLLLLRFIQTYRAGFRIGSDAFGENFATYGFWGHLMIISMIFTIGNIILIRKDKHFKLMLCMIILALIFIFLNQVKGWVIIPIVSGIIIRLKDSTLRLRLNLVFLICLLGSLLFFMSYYISLVLLMNDDDNSWFLQFIIDHFIFYLTSGINGLSEICANGCHEGGNLVTAISTFFYPLRFIAETIFGSARRAPGIGYVDIGYGLSNVRTIMGDFYLLGEEVGFTILVLFNSLICYIFLWLTKVNTSLSLNIAYGFMLGVLTMGWFSSYTNLLTIYEIPIYCLIIYVFNVLYRKKKYKLQS